ncbi:MAG: porphobilinogen synthase, partial [Candidatus Marinimicrobia bacterium]|nr:porphobilinogen synthase [Candidatus Neomarinimicrobiota bacterium]
MSDHDAPAPFIRPRRNRRSQAIRDMVAETHFDLAQLIMPLFIIP